MVCRLGRVYSTIGYKCKLYVQYLISSVMIYAQVTARRCSPRSFYHCLLRASANIAITKRKT